MHDTAFAPSDRLLRQFGALWVVFFAAMAAWQEVHHERHALAIVLAVLAVTVGPAGIAGPRLIRPVFIAWMTVVYPIGWVVSRVVLGVLFYGLLTPIAVILRAIGRDELMLKESAGARTYWQPKAQISDKSRYLGQY